MGQIKGNMITKKFSDNINFAVIEYNTPEGEDISSNNKAESFIIKSSYSFLKPTVTKILTLLIKNHNFPEVKESEFSIVLTELLLLLIEKGNRNDFNKNIIIKYSVDENIIKISLKHEGPGLKQEEITSSEAFSLIELFVKDTSWNKDNTQITINYSFK